MDYRSILVVIAYAFFFPLIWQGGNYFCKWCLGSLKAAVENKDEDSNLKAGRYIGLLERLLILIGVTFSSGELILAVIALKTVGRYQELDKKVPAEYFLIGSLASLLYGLIISGVF